MVSAVVGELKFPNSSTHALATGHINTQRADHTPACLSQCTNNHPDHRSCAHLQAHLEKHAVQPFLTSLTSCLTMVLRFFFLPPQPDNPSNALWNGLVICSGNLNSAICSGRKAWHSQCQVGKSPGAVQIGC